jgi:hypothetical protein
MAEIGESRCPNEKARLSNMIGILEHILESRYGLPRIISSGPLLEYRWNDSDELRSCVLHKNRSEKIDWGRNLSPQRAGLQPIYGDAIGGFLVGDSLKVAMLGAEKLWGLYTLAKIQDLQPVHRALQLEPGISFFMDSANVWYYGAKNGDLWEYDEPFDELNNLGDIAVQINELMSRWEVAKPR